MTIPLDGSMQKLETFCMQRGLIEGIYLCLVKELAKLVDKGATLKKI